MNKTKLRGVVYSLISLGGLGYELFFVPQPRIMVIILYSLIVGIGVLYIYIFSDQ